MENETGDLERAAIAYEHATQHAPRWTMTESLRCNLLAVKFDVEDEAAWWNAGIAATALGDWKAARLAWQAVGIEVPPGEGEIRMRLGLTPIRLKPHGQGEGDDQPGRLSCSPAPSRLRSLALRMVTMLGAWSIAPSSTRATASASGRRTTSICSVTSRSGSAKVSPRA